MFQALQRGFRVLALKERGHHPARFAVHPHLGPVLTVPEHPDLGAGGVEALGIGGCGRPLTQVRALASGVVNAGDVVKAVRRNQEHRGRVRRGCHARQHRGGRREGRIGLGIKPPGHHEAQPPVRGQDLGEVITEEAAELLQTLVQNKMNIFISGGTGTGKTTLLNVLSTFIPANERIITIEDAMELQLPTIRNLVRLEARIAGPDGRGELSLSDLIRSSLRLRPDRIIVGEVRGREAYDMLQAMQTGHPGSLSTGHGNSAAGMLERLSLFLLTASQLPWEACRRLIASSLHFLIHLSRQSDGTRVIEQITEITDYVERSFALRVHFQRQHDGVLRRVS